MKWAISSGEMLLDLVFEVEGRGGSEDAEDEEGEGSMVVDRRRWSERGVRCARNARARYILLMVMRCSSVERGLETEERMGGGIESDRSEAWKEAR